ncbi:hypothetical protein KP22_10340 [Pectobacterium betavasculorum]|uniref:Uncharacterized protein n=1 Tax=Pectobacterium betavasculorum TaxID=55207 RepID=A0A093RPQ3_9GAMM|nr:hypothetical protein KP22_10340 [Pectobacterium betavasculorum]
MGSITKPVQICKKADVSCVVSRVFLCAISTTPDSGRSIAAALRTQAFLAEILPLRGTFGVRARGQGRQ